MILTQRSNTKQINKNFLIKYIYNIYNIVLVEFTKQQQGTLLYWLIDRFIIILYPEENQLKKEWKTNCFEI